ncbi:Vacuolar protein sorting-associated protein 51 [Linnemannia gamsii]|uniref:Vacuolar protein sorting-associated protein 51 homolog n=1 Tax=Linnemannia gamsii TaxID=64522 RepID=A0ABQ7K539_9FUNG|nr:Vacuolar protein sorting-associated protein 51 [Linnemannia gamsii]
MAAGTNATILPLEGHALTIPHRTPATGAAGNKAGIATGTATRRRAKSFLRNYYGIQQADASNQDGSKDNSSSHSGPTSKADPYDLDSHAFEVDKYMHKMFVEKQLPGLVQADNELVADIRQLDGDMKTLMKSNVDNLESEMARLTQNIGKIATSSSAIHSSLGGKREKIRQLNGVHSLLTKLQFVFELPTNLHQCLETESYTQAVKSYCRTLHLLQHYKHLTVFTGIERECKAIMVQVAQKIRQKMCSETATITEITESVGLLLALKEDPVALWKQYLELSMSALRKMNTKTLEEIKTLPLYSAPPAASPTPATPKRSTKKSSRNGSNTPTIASGVSGIGSTEKEKEMRIKASSPPPADKVAYLNVFFLKQVEAFVVSFMGYFFAPTTTSGTPASSTSGGMAVAALGEEFNGSDQIPPAWVAKDTRAQANLTREQISEASTKVMEAASNMISKYLDTIRSFLDYPKDIFSIEPQVHVHVLQNLYLGTKSSTGLCQLIGFDTLATGLIQNWEIQLIERALGKVKERLMSRIVQQDIQLAQQSSRLNNNATAGDVSLSLAESFSTAATPTFSWAIVLKETTLWLLESFKVDTIPFLEKCMSSDAQFLETREGRALFLKNFQDEFKAFWEWILKEMQQRSSAISPSSPSLAGKEAVSKESFGSRTSSLVMSQLCFELSTSVVEQLYKTLSKTLFRVGKRNRSGSFLIESYEEPPVLPQLQWDCKYVIQACQESGHVLLDGFIARTGNELSWLVMDVRSETDFMTLESPPTGVSVAWETIYRQLNEIERQVMMVYGDEGERLGNHEISSESTRRESAFRPGGGGGGVRGGEGGGSHSGSRPSHQNDSMASFGSNTMNSRFDHQQRNLLLSNIDKLFSDRVEIFIRCQDLNRTGIMFGIIKILLKAWAESVRMKTFGKGGFQQIQVDAEFAKVWLWRFATADERLMHSLLEEAQQTAYRRCIDAVPLDIHTVELIINSFER